MLLGKQEHRASYSLKLYTQAVWIKICQRTLMAVQTQGTAPLYTVSKDSDEKSDEEYQMEDQHLDKSQQPQRMRQANLIRQAEMIRQYLKKQQVVLTNAPQVLFVK